MRILYIGNYAPPFEEENLHNLSLLKKLEEDGHNWTVINISENPSTDERFIDTTKPIDFVMKLIRHGWRKNIIHFSTKGYLRLGLLKLMIAILIGTFFRAKTFVTIHSELFSVQGQMRSPVGGRQTLFTAFTIANKIMCSDKDTYDVASMYMKKSNFELIPSFISIPDEIVKTSSPSLKKLKDRKKVMIFSGVTYPSFIFEIIKELLSNYPLPSDIGIVIAFSEKRPAKLKHLMEETGKEMLDQLIFIDRDDIKATLLAYSKADTVIRPMSCEGRTFFESFAISVKKLRHIDNQIYFPGGLLFIKEGDITAMCVCIINTMLCVESGTVPDSKFADSYKRIKELYEE
jgi:hypothetical protein